MIFNKEDVERFWSKVEKSSGCWIWQASFSSRGYGQIFMGGKPWLAHRASWAIANNALIRKGMVICHHCDNPACVNPQHLFIGTQKDNLQDAKRKGKTTRGIKNARAKLTPTSVIKIRNLFAQGISSNELAKRHQMSRAAIKLIVKGKNWPHIGGPRTFRDERKSKGGDL